MILVVAFALAAFFAVGSPVRLSAQDSASTLQSDYSYAELFVGSAKNPYSYSPGVARVSGDVKLNAEDPTRTELNLRIYPVDTRRNPDANGPNYADMEFKSERTRVMPGGELGVSGELILHRVEKPVLEAQANEAFSGPVFGDAVVKTYRSNVMFVIPMVKNAAARQSADFSAASTIGYENFPQLLPTLMRTNWPVVVQDEECAPSGNIEDYSGQKCTGKVIATSSDYAVQGWPGEDFSGPKPLLAGNQVTIKLKMVVGSSANTQQITGEEAMVQTSGKR
jgi:polyisoprenoid-binding protein YceI